MLTMSQFAKKHGLSRQRIHQLILQRRIPRAKKTQVIGGPVGGIWVIPESAKIKGLTAINR